MKGHIRQRSKGSWEICIDMGRAPAIGQRKGGTLRRSGAPKETHRRELAELLVGIEQRTYVRWRQLTLAQWLEEGISDYVTIN